MLRMVERARSDTLHLSKVNNIYLSYLQMEARREHHQRAMSMMRLILSHTNSKLHRLRKPMDAHKKLVLLLSKHDIPRVRQLINVQVRDGRSISRILKLVERAINGTYSARDYGGLDLDRAELCKLIGGSRLLFAMGKSSGFASGTTLKRRRPLPNFIISWDSNVYDETVHENMTNFVVSRVEPTRSAQTLMIDDLNMEARLRPSEYHSHVLGAGRESDFRGVSLDVRSYADLQLLGQAVNERKIVLAQELTVFGIAPNAEARYSVSYVAASGTARKDAKATHMTPFISTILAKWLELKLDETHGPLTTIQKDGASIMNASLHALLTEFRIDAKSPIGIKLFGADGNALLLFVRFCGRSPQKPLVDGVDAKHVGKRFRMALKWRCAA